MSARLLKILLVACGSLAVALGVIGIFVPLMPTTVFLLLAAACYARSSDRLYRRLVGSRWLGGYIRSSREGGGMTRRQKAFTLALLWIGIAASAIWSVEGLVAQGPAAAHRPQRHGPRRAAEGGGSRRAPRAGRRPVGDTHRTPVWTPASGSVLGRSSVLSSSQRHCWPLQPHGNWPPSNSTSVMP